MRQRLIRVVLSGMIWSLIGMMNFLPAGPGKYSVEAAEPAQWSEGILHGVINSPLSEEGREKGVGPIMIEMENGSIFPMDPKARIKDLRNNPISLDQLTNPSKIRYLLDKGVVKELVLIEALPR